MMKSEIEEIKRRVPLLRVVQGRVKMEKRGEEYWGCCPFHNEKTPSFAVKEKNGEQVFYCQGCGKGGDVIRFIEFVDHCTTKQAIEKLKDLGGGWQDNANRVAETFQPVAAEEPKKTLPLEKWAGCEKALAANKPALDWLLNVRGITLETAQALHLGYAEKCAGFLKPEDEHARDKGWIMFPRIIGDRVVAVKMRGVAAKAFSQLKNMDAKALFNVETINPLEPVFVTEGELDTVIMEQAGFRAVSMPNSTTKLTPEAKNKLKEAACVYLAGDNDGKVGNMAMRQLQRELGENTYMILWPGAKDANEFFLKVCKRDVGEFQRQIDKLISKARSTPIEGFTSIIERLLNTTGTDAGKDPNRLHFSKLPNVDRMNYNPPGSVVVIYSTYSGTGKSVFTTQIMVEEARRGQIVVVYSPELRDDGYLALVAAQTLGPTRDGGLNRAGFISREDYIETAHLLDRPTEQGTDFRYYVGHSLPETDPEKVLEFIEQTIKVTGATRFVIDTLHRVVEKMPRESQTEAEGRVVKKLEALGIKYGTIFVLIGQSNKEAEDLKELRHDAEGVLRGSRELMDVAYGVYLLHRKKKNTDTPTNDLLELETKLILKKDRGKGPGGAVVRLVYNPKDSRFYEISLNAGDEPPMQEQSSDGFEQGGGFD